jgi:hypothetical protein
LGGAGDDGRAGAGDHVDFAADAELAGKVEAGFDGEAGVGQEEALVVGFEVVEVSAVAVDADGDVVAGAVGEEGGEAGVADDVAGGVVGLPAGDGTAFGVGALDDGDGGVAGVADGVEDEVLAIGGGAADDAGPGDVVPDGGGVVGQLGPDIDEDEVTLADGAGGFGRGVVVGVGGVGAGGAVGAVVGPEAGLGDFGVEELDNAELVGGGIAAGGFADEAPAGGEDGVEAALGFEVGGDLGFGEDSLEDADEVGGADDVLAEFAEELDGARVDHGDVHDGVAWGVLHGDGGRAVEEGDELGFELLPTGIFGFGSGEGVELEGLDAVDELAGFADGGDEVEPAAGDEGIFVEAEDAVGDGVAVVVVVEEPAVEVVVAQGGLDVVEVHGFAEVRLPPFFRKTGRRNYIERGI